MQRLAHLRGALATAPVAAGAEAHTAAPAPGAPVLLSDEQMQRFVADGFLVIPLAEDDDGGVSHRDIHREARRLWQSSGEAGGAGLGNNIFPAIPQLGDVMSSPQVDGALRSLLGDGYTMNAHRHMHNSTNQGQQAFHKDSRALCRVISSVAPYHRSSRPSLAYSSGSAPRPCLTTCSLLTFAAALAVPGL